LLQRSINTAVSANRKPVIVVLGANADMVRPTIDNQLVHIIHNPDWEEGMASSIRCGIEALQTLEQETESIILMLCDQPFADAALLEQLINAKTNNGIAACAYNDTIGTPALFDSTYFEELLALQGQEGAKKVLLKYLDDVVTVPFPLGGVDVDTEEDYEKISALK
jgi:molybdenum cofactor cytidylyltransferase